MPISDLVVVLSVRSIIVYHTINNYNLKQTILETKFRDV